MPARVATLAPRMPRKEVSRQTTRALHTGTAAWRRLRDQVLVRDLYTCQHCGKLITKKGDAHVDHINEDAHLESSNQLQFLQLLCASCHGVKTRQAMRNGPRGV